MERNEVTYVLSFYPKDLEYDGEFHKLKVKADLPRGARMSHRAGYYAPKDFEDLHPMEKALLASEAIASAVPRKEIDVDVLAAPFRANAEQAYVPVILEIDGFSLLAGHQKPNLDLEIYVYATDARGEMRDFVTQSLSFDLDQGRHEAMAQTGVKYYGHLELPPDHYLLRVLVRNANTGKTAVVSQELHIPDWQRGLPQVLPPFFLEQPGQWFMVREGARPTRDGAPPSDGVVYPFTLGGEPFVPAARPLLEGDGPTDVCLVAYNMGEGAIRLEGTIYGDDGLPYDQGHLSLVERLDTAADGLDKLRAAFDPGDLRPGAYTLDVTVTNESSGRMERSSIPFRVEG
jgi:hypothetical protein